MTETLQVFGIGDGMAKKQNQPPNKPQTADAIRTGIPTLGHHLAIEHAEFDGMDVKLDLARCSFFDVGFKDAIFRGGRITHSRFERCYLRNAEFRGVDLTGTTFVRCNLGHASFDSAKFDYVSFEECQLDYGAILQNLPSQPNLQRHLLRSLRVNAASRKDVEETQLLLAELAAERKELRATFIGANAYFRKKPMKERARAFRAWLSHQVQKFVWGYGLQLRVLLRAGAAIVLLGALAVWGFAIPFGIDGTSRSLTLSESVFLSIGSFTTARAVEISPVNLAGKLFVVFESFCGTGFLGLLAATAYRKIAR